jgi:hypothetical protein
MRRTRLATHKEARTKYAACAPPAGSNAIACAGPASLPPIDQAAVSGGRGVSPEKALTPEHGQDTLEQPVVALNPGLLLRFSWVGKGGAASRPC